MKIKKALAANNLGSERSISESLALINQHVTSLGEVNHLAAEPIVGVLAPPPGFSDPESNYSDNESLSSNGSKGFQKKSNNTKVSFSTKTMTTSKVGKQWNMTRSVEGMSLSELELITIFMIPDHIRSQSLKKRRSVIRSDHDL